MKPTTDIVEELRLYNRWRRGDEAITAPDPTALGKLLDDAADRIEHLFASGIHTCNADCQRPMCVLRRERDKAQNDLARVTAELEHHKSVKETIDSAHKELSREHAALRARVAELEAQIERELQQATADNSSLAERLTAAELERDRLGAELEELQGSHDLNQIASDALNDLRADLARVTAERDSQRADIERLVWNLGGCDTIASGWGKPGDYNEEMALPALDSVSRMASERDALRARVAELESSCRDLRVTYEQNASQCVRLNRELALKPDTVEWLNGVTIQRQRAEQAEAHITELVAVLRDAANALESDSEKERHECWNRIRDLSLASVESATPDHIPDAAKMVSATPAKQEDAR